MASHLLDYISFNPGTVSSDNHSSPRVCHKRIYSLPHGKLSESKCRVLQHWGQNRKVAGIRGQVIDQALFATIVVIFNQLAI
jgi:hypothetical protein